MVIGMMPLHALAAEGEDLPGLTVTARYCTNRLSWTAESGVNYTVERSEDGETGKPLAPPPPVRIWMPMPVWVPGCTTDFASERMSPRVYRVNKPVWKR